MGDAVHYMNTGEEVDNNLRWVVLQCQGVETPGKFGFWPGTEQIGILLDKEVHKAFVGSHTNERTEESVP